MIYAALADDITGAMDAGAQLVGRGHRVRVLLSSGAHGSAAGGAGWLILNTESRNLPPDEAAGAVRRGVRELANMGAQLRYKKIDSTLRGNVGAEMDAALDATEFGAAAVAPALIEMGRTTRNGTHHVNGVPLADTELAMDPLSPVRDSEIASILRRQSRRGTMLLTLAQLRGGGARAAMDEAVEAGALLVCDAESVDDLRTIAEAAAGREILCCGSAGLFRYMDAQGEAQPAPPPASSAPIVLLSGSPARMNKRQIRHLLAHRPDIAHFAPDQSALTGEAWHAERARIIGGAVAAFREGRHVLIDAAEDGKDALAARFGGDWALLATASARVQALIEDSARALSGTGAPGGLFLLGGDTAMAAARGADASAIDLLGEGLPLIPLGEIVDGAWRSVPVITKAGGFGAEDALSTLFDRQSRTAFERMDEVP